MDMGRVIFFSKYFSETIRTCTSILETLLSVIDVASLLNMMHADLIAGLCHPNNGVKKLCFVEVGILLQLLQDYFFK